MVAKRIEVFLAALILPIIHVATPHFVSKDVLLSMDMVLVLLLTCTKVLQEKPLYITVLQSTYWKNSH